MNKKELEILLDRYDIEYSYGNEQEVAEGLKIFDKALLDIGYDISTKDKKRRDEKVY